MSPILSRLGLAGLPAFAFATFHGLSNLPLNGWTVVLGLYVGFGLFAAWSACWAKAEI